METKDGMIEYCKQVAKKNKWIFNKDKQVFDDLINGLVFNRKTYGYQSCPCRMAAGEKELDRDLICPCIYAPQDVKEFGACYCNLYMRTDFYKIGVDFLVVPERRSVEKEKAVLDYINEKAQI
jgi:ferredoxin-thioredoxin reductase catalytic subunit